MKRRVQLRRPQVLYEVEVFNYPDAESTRSIRVSGPDPGAVCHLLEKALRGSLREAVP